MLGNPTYLKLNWQCLWCRMFSSTTQWPKNLNEAKHWFEFDAPSKSGLTLLSLVWFLAGRRTKGIFIKHTFGSNMGRVLSKIKHRSFPGSKAVRSQSLLLHINQHIYLNLKIIHKHKQMNGNRKRCGCLVLACDGPPVSTPTHRLVWALPQATSPLQRSAVPRDPCGERIHQRLH